VHGGAELYISCRAGSGKVGNGGHDPTFRGKGGRGDIIWE